MCVGYPDIRTDILENGYPDVKKYPDIFTVQKTNKVISTVLKKPCYIRYIRFCILNRDNGSGSKIWEPYGSSSYTKKQLSEYVNLRRTQVNLRLLSFQRQSLDYLDDETMRAASTPVGKQTVADAAVNKGKTSSLNLYDNEFFPAFNDGSSAPLTPPFYDNQRSYVNTPTKCDNI
uniref:Uncharacterized protein n=1 Tax=Romanomermis culicivorax TaxID=13658 RepID=A0A915HQ97_ROMCU